MKTLFVLSLLTFASASQAATCDVEMAKKYVAGIELVASDITNVDSGDRVNGVTISKSDIKAVSADSAYVVTVTNEKETYYTPGNYSKYVVTLKKVGSACYPASITLIGNTSKK